MQFAISACYYSMYYSLYAILMKIGIKYEIHTCTLEFMKRLLNNFYSKEDFKIINKAFDARNTSQYYVDKIVAKEDIDFIMSNAPYFLSKSKDIFIKNKRKGYLRNKKRNRSNNQTLIYSFHLYNFYNSKQLPLT